MRHTASIFLIQIPFSNRLDITEIPQNPALICTAAVSRATSTCKLHRLTRSTPTCACNFSNFYDRAEISVHERWSMSRAVENGAAKERRRIQSAEVRWGCTLSGVGVWCEGTGGQAISQLQRQSLSSREYIDTSGAHWPVYNIAYRYVRAPTFRPSRTSSRARNIAPKWFRIDRGILDRPRKLSGLFGIHFLQQE